MNDRSRAYWEAFNRMKEFGTDNAADFPSGIAHDQFIQLGTVITAANASSAEQLGAAAHVAQMSEAKGNSREYVRSLMDAMHDLTPAMAYQYPTVEEVFKMPKNRTDADLLAAARAFHANSAPFEAAFIAYGLSPDFRDTLHDATDDFESALNAHNAALSDRIEAQAELTDWITQGMRCRRILNPVVNQKYKNNPGKRAAWESASHIERPTKKKKSGGDTDGDGTPPLTP